MLTEVFWAGEQRLGGLLRLQHLRPERHHRRAPSDQQHVLRHRLQRPRPAALARRGSSRGRTHPGRELPNSGPEQLWIQADSGAGAHAGEEHCVTEAELCLHRKNRLGFAKEKKDFWSMDFCALLLAFNQETVWSVLEKIS